MQYNRLYFDGVKFTLNTFFDSRFRIQNLTKMIFKDFSIEKVLYVFELFEPVEKEQFLGVKFEHILNMFLKSRLALLFSEKRPYLIN